MKKILIGFTIIFSILFLYLVYPVQEKPDIVKFLILSQIIFIIYLGILFLANKIHVSFSNNKHLTIFMIVIAVMIRIAVAYGSVSQPYLSDDVYRYVWEGKIVSHAYNPFLIAPTDMQSTPFADSLIYPNINHPYLPTIYPPLSQYLFTVAYLMSGDSIVGFKILSVLFELFSIFLIYLLVKKYKIPDWTFLIYLFSPLIIIEFIFSNHLDILGLPFFLLLLLKLKDCKPKPFAVGILLALAVLVKLYLLFFLPFIFFYYRKKQKIKFISSFTIIMILFYLPFIASGGYEITGSLWKYLGDWQYNGSIFLLLKQLFSQETARILCWSLFVAASGLLLFWKKTKHRIELQMFLVFAIYLLLSPAIFNWYLLWVIPFILIFQNKSFLILTGTIMLSYHVLIGYYNNGVWTDYPALRILTYLPFYLLLLYEIYISLRKKKPVT